MSDARTITRRSALAALGATAIVGTTAASAFATATVPGSKRVFIAGDSTAGQKHQDVAPETGSGMVLPFYLTPRAVVDNRALSGRSSKSFIDEGHLAGILNAIRPGDVLLVQFGHNDQKSADPKRYTEPWTTFQAYLRQYIDGARAQGATPVLATPAERRRFDRNQNAYTTHGDYPAAMRALAAQESVPLIDVQAQTLALWQQLGPEETKKYFLYTDDGRRDNTHFNPPGAAAIARMFVEGLLSSGVLSEGYVRRLDEEVPASWFTWPEGTTPPPAPE